ncbi:MAG: hypothetical protein AAGB31_13025 [Bdellovibrio sp.]
MAKASVPYDEHLIEPLRADEELQIEYVKASLEDNVDMPKAILTRFKNGCGGKRVHEVVIERDYCLSWFLFTNTNCV